MLRNTLLALTATAGLIGTTEFTSTTARADSFLRIGVGGRGGSVVVGVGGHVHRPVVVAPPTVVYYSPPPVVYTPPPVVVTPVCTSYTVLFRPAPVAPWQAYGTYASPARAQEAVDALRFRGYEVMETTR